LPSSKTGPSASGKTIGFGAAFPWPARSSAYASPAVSPRPAQGWLPARAGSPLAGQDSHLLDDKQSFMETSHPPIPFDPQGLVALFYLSAQVCLRSTQPGCMRSGKPILRAHDRLIDLSQTAQERSRNIIRSQQVRDLINSTVIIR